MLWFLHFCVLLASLRNGRVVYATDAVGKSCPEADRRYPQANPEDKTRQKDAERILKVDVPGRFHWLDQFLHRYQFSKTLETLSMQAGQ